MAESYLNKTGLSKLVEIIKNLFDKKLDKSGGAIAGDLVVDGTITGNLNGTADMASRIPFVNYTGTSTAIVVNNVEGFPEVLTAGASIRIGIRSATFKKDCTLNVNGTGAKDVYFEGHGIGGRGILLVYNVYSFVYDGSYWRCMDANQLRLGDSTIGSTTQPVYLNAGKPTQCNINLSQLEVVETLPTTGLVEGRQVLYNGFPFTYDGENWISTTEDLGGREETHAEEFVFQPTGGADLSIKDGYASIRKIKGNTLVWNQLNKKFMNTTRYGVSIQSDDNSTLVINGTCSANTDFYGVPSTGAEYSSIPAGHKGYYKLEFLSGEVSGNPVFSFGSITLSLGRRVIAADSTNYRYLLLRVYSGNVFTDATFRFQVFDLTQMFGAGNEPSTVEEFEQIFPNDYYEYNAGQLLSFEGDALRSVGFNAFDGEKAVVLKGQTYYLGGTYETLQFKADGEAALDVAVPSDKLYTPESNGELYATGTDICINLSHSGYRNGEYEPYKEFILPLDFIKTIKDADGNVLFPDGLRSAGSAYDEIVYDEGLCKYKAVKRVDSVDLGTLRWVKEGSSGSHLRFISPGLSSVIKKFSDDTKVANVLSVDYVPESWYYVWANFFDKTIGVTGVTLGIYDETYASSTGAQFKTAMSGKILQYELATPVEVILDDISLGYEANDFGTEEIVGNTTPIIPMRADIRYNFNAVDMIRGNYFSLQQQKKRLNDQSNEIDQLQSQMEQLDETYIPLSQKGVANGVATLGADGKVPEAQLPEISGANNVLNFDNSDAFPTEGDKHTLYVASEERKVYAWTGSQYFAIGEYENATTTSPGLMSANDKAKLDGIESNANNYTLPTAGRNTLGGVKTTSSVTSASGYTACPIISGVPYYKESLTQEWTYEQVEQSELVDFNQARCQLMHINGGGIRIGFRFPQSGEYMLTIVNDGALADIQIGNPGVEQMVVPQQIAIDHGGGVAVLRIVYISDSILIVGMDYPMIMM